MRKLRVLTCTPICFKGDHTFFARDSGLLSVGLQLNGIESRAVMPGPSMPEDDPRLIRTTYTNLSDAGWWRAQDSDAVIFFSWAMPEYTPIAEAIKASGSKLLVFLDSAGFWSPRSNGFDWFKAQWDSCRRKRGLSVGLLRYLASISRSFVPTAFDYPRLKHMNLADVVTVTSPLVLERTRRYAQVYGFRKLEIKVTRLPLPVSTHMRYEGQLKRKRVICVARWLPEDWPEKGPKLLLSSLDAFLEKRPDYEAIVIGRGASALRSAPFFPRDLCCRNLQLLDYLPNKDIAPFLAESRISVCSSFHESYHIASFEAACCGCSVVALRSPDLPALQFLAETNGTLAIKETPKAFSEALVKEATKWDDELRSPSITSQQWQTETHANKVAARAVEILRL
jgi:glycosyltransferase involved in cell wall biosynthesis